MAPGDGSPTPLADSVSTDDLQRIAQLGDLTRYLSSPATEQAPPANPLPLPVAASQTAYSNLYAMARQMGINPLISMLWAAFWAFVVGAVSIVVTWITKLASLLFTPILAAVLGALDSIRKGLDPSIGLLAVSVLNEFLGTDFTAAHLPFGTGTGDHLTRARAIGSILMTQLETEFAPPGGVNVVPSVAPAATFSGLAVNFGLATGILASIGGAFPVGHLEELRELGEEVAKNIGLGRLVRRALTPLVTVLVSQPMQWYLNQKYHPTQIPAGMLFNPYAGGFVDPALLHQTLDLEGWSTDKINALVSLHSRKLSLADVEALYRQGTWSQQQTLDYLVRLGYPADVAPTVLQAFAIQRTDPWITKLVSEIESEVKAGAVLLEELVTVVNGLPILQVEKDIIIGTAQYKVKAHHGKVHTLGHGQLVTAFEHGLLTATDLTDHWTAQGYSAADQQVLLAEVLLTAGKLAEAKKVAQFNYDAKVAKAFKAGLPQPPPPAILSS
jgi:hypothetical protein